MTIAGERTTAMEQALEVACDALQRRARILEGQDPEVAAELLVLMTMLTRVEPRDVFKRTRAVRDDGSVYRAPSRKRVA